MSEAKLKNLKKLLASLESKEQTPMIEAQIEQLEREINELEN